MRVSPTWRVPASRWPDTLRGFWPEPRKTSLMVRRRGRSRSRERGSEASRAARRVGPVYQDAAGEVGDWVTFSPVRPAQGTKMMLESGKEALVKKAVHAVRMAVKRD